MPNPKHQQFDWNGIELLVDEITVTGAVNGALTGVTVLTDNTAGTANDTLEALADGTVYANDVAAIRNNFADLAAKVNAIINAMN